MKKVFALAPLLLAACAAVGPNYQAAPPQVPAQFTQSAGRASFDNRWWSSFQDPMLNHLMQQAVDNSPDLAIARARLAQARATQSLVAGNSGPNLSAAGHYSNDTISRKGEMFANLPPGQGQNHFPQNTQIGLDASWEIDLFGYQQRLDEAAQARSAASAERLGDAALTLAAEVARNYFELRAGQQRVALALATEKLDDETIRLTRLAGQAGDVAHQDLERSEAQRNSREASLAMLRLGVRGNLSALSALTAQDMANLAAQLDGDEAHPAALPPLPPLPAAGLPSALLRQRPDLRAGDRDVAAANADLGVAVAAQYPRFSLVGDAGWNSIVPGQLVSNAARFWSLGPQFSLPLFNSGRLKSQEHMNEAALEAAVQGYRKAVYAALADTELALTRIARDEDQRQQSDKLRQRQARIVELTALQLKAGDASRLNLIEAQRLLAVQQDPLLQAQAQSLTALVALYKALGGGWQP